MPPPSPREIPYLPTAHSDRIRHALGVEDRLITAAEDLHGGVGALAHSERKSFYEGLQLRRARVQREGSPQS